MKLRHKKMVETRRLYAFEAESPLLAPIRRQVSCEKLRAFAKKLGYTKIFFDDGIWSWSGGVSYYDTGTKEIHIAKKQHDYITMIHEIVHAKGNDRHDKYFVWCELLLLALEFRFNFAELVVEARKYGLQI
jgi:hypothetical protein